MTSFKMPTLEETLKNLEVTIERLALKSGETWKGRVYPVYMDAAVEHFKKRGYDATDEFLYTYDEDLTWLVVKKK